MFWSPAAADRVVAFMSHWTEILALMLTASDSFMAAFVNSLLLILKCLNKPKLLSQNFSPEEL